MEDISINKIGKNNYLQFNKLNEFNNLIHGFTIKSNNFKKEDTDYIKICEDLNLNQNYVKIEKQIHSNIVKCIENNDLVTDVDGLITNTKNLPLFIRTADCISLILYDPVKEVIGNIHSGWKGTLSRIIEKSIFKMKEKYHCDEKDIIVGIFPSILYCHFEVENDVYSLYEKEFKNLKNISKYMKIGEIKDSKQKYYIDTVGINKEMLINMGIKEENIYLSNKCTFCNNELFNSHRQKDNGRNLTVVEMKGDN